MNPFKCECVKRLELAKEWLETFGQKWHEHWFMCPVFREGFKESASMEECCVFHGENCYDPEPQGTCCPNCPGPAGVFYRSFERIAQQEHERFLMAQKLAALGVPLRLYVGDRIDGFMKLREVSDGD